jgi:hypothetical protein
LPQYIYLRFRSQRLFDQPFSQKVCVFDQTQPLHRNRWAATVGLVDHAVVMVLDQAGIFGQAFFEKGYDHAVSRVFDQTFFEKVCEQAFF